MHYNFVAAGSAKRVYYNNGGATIISCDRGVGSQLTVSLMELLCNNDT